MDLLQRLLKAEKLITLNPEKWPSNFLMYVTLATQKLQNHLWYLSERLVQMVLFSEHVNAAEKQSIRRAMLKCKEGVCSQKQQMPFSKNIIGKSLKDYIGPDSWTFFNLHIEYSFFKLPVSKWSTSTSFACSKQAVANLPVVNGAAEPVLGLATDFNVKTAPKSKPHLQTP